MMQAMLMLTPDASLIQLFDAKGLNLCTVLRDSLQKWVAEEAWAAMEEVFCQLIPCGETFRFLVILKVAPGMLDRLANHLSNWMLYDLVLSYSSVDQRVRPDLSSIKFTTLTNLL
ncbi:E4 ORFE [Tree shrew adenovirus 1]|uniref:E4 ORFE n=1 Tax=Tree shrew adenovirus serotype 1 TaxID=47680 RepID=UPI00001D9793|nr:E4 ORFE [Tree shrew adenovirus 1]